MKQTYTLIACFFLSMVVLQAQSTLTIDPCPVVKDGSIWELNKAQAELSNSASSDLDIAWERVEVDIPAGWSTSVCDPNQCYAPFSDEPLGPSSELLTFSIPASGTIDGAQFYCQFIPNGIPGSGTVRLDVYDANDLSNVTQCTFTVNAVATGIDEPKVEAVVITYPNPVTNKMFISGPASEQIAAIEVFNIVGKKVSKFEFNGQTNEVDIDLSELKEGMYLARIISAKGELIGSKRFSKVN
jgi:hypothetical protein